MSNNHQSLRATGLHKQYGNRWVVSDVDIEVKKVKSLDYLVQTAQVKQLHFI